MFKPAHLRWGHRAAADDGALAFLRDLRPGSVDKGDSYAAFNVMLGETGAPALIETPVLSVPYGASSEYKRDGAYRDSDKVTFKAYLDASVPAQAAFAQFLDAFSGRVADLLSETQGLAVATMPAKAPQVPASTTGFGLRDWFASRTSSPVKRDARGAYVSVTVPSAKAGPGGVRPSIKEPANWRVSVFQFDDNNNMATAPPSAISHGGMTAKIVFELRVTNTAAGLSVALTARSVIVLDREEAAAGAAALAEDEDVQEFKRRRVARSGAGTPTSGASGSGRASEEGA